MSNLRPPVIVILGHVDHGKTTLLDSIRKTNVAAREHGGITQATSAYQVEVDKHLLTFIDTPGHAAFSNMRTRGAGVADIAILIVSAVDSVMPQTVESIKIIQEAKVPYIVAINKIDSPEANTDKVIKDLLRHNVLLENYGGDVPFVKISAKNGDGITDLLGLIDLISQMNEIGSKDLKTLQAIIIESKLDQNRGPVATAIVKSGQLKSGDKVYVGSKEEKIRALFDYNGKPVSEVVAGSPVLILGLSTVQKVGEIICSEQGIVNNEQSKRNIFDENKLNVILRADTVGSIEAIVGSLDNSVNILQAETGEITEADILLAKSTKAFVLGFNIKASNSVLDLAKTEKVLVRTYKIIYELLEEIADAAAGQAILGQEEILGVAKIVAQFPFEKLKVAGVKIIDGRLARGDTIRIGELKAKIKSIRLGKDEISKVEAGKECGVLIDPQIDFKLGDDIISYRI